jgi:hypothetical protein
VGLIIYPSEDFDFVNLVELSDLILDLFCIHSKYTGYCGYGYNIPSITFINTFLGAWATLRSSCRLRG